MATKKPKPITYSTAENFNPLEDYNVGAQSPILVNGEFSGVNRRISSQNSNPIDRFDFKNFNEDLQGSNERGNSPVTYSQPTARYETKDSARIASQHNAGITYDKDIGYVPKASRVPLTPEQVTQRSRDSVAKMEAANSPADMAAYKAKTFAKESARVRAEGNTDYANRLQGYAAEQTAKARQLGYTGDISKATINNPERTASKPAASTPSASKPAPSASTPKPSTSSPASQKTSGIDWTMNPPENATQETMRQNDMAIKKANEDTVKKADDKFNANQIKGHMKTSEDYNKRIAENKSQFEANDKIKDLKDELAHDRKVEQNFKDKAAKATTPDQKEHALQMAGEYAEKARKREGEIAELEKGSKVDIPKLSKTGEKTKAPSTTDPMADLMAGIPTMNNSSAYNAGGASGFFTRDGKVIPITA